MSKDAAILTEHPSKEACKRHQSEVYLSKPSRVLLSRTRKINDFRSFHCTGHIKNGTVSTQQRNKKISLERIFPMECVQKRRNATCQFRKLSSGKRYAARNTEKLIDSAKESSNSKVQMLNEIESLIGKEPRSYAQMIASYTETMYGSSSNSGIPKDSPSTVMINGIRRSPFSTASVDSLKSKNKHKGAKNGNICAAGLNTFSQDAKFSSEAIAIRYYCRHDSRNIIGSIGRSVNEFEKTSSSYATMIEKYSNGMNLGADSNGWSGSSIPKRNASTKLDEMSVILFDSKDVDNKSTEIASDRSKNATKKLTETKKDKPGSQDQDNWMTRVDDIIKDLKRITAKTETIESKPNDKWMLQSVNERAHWLDRVVDAHKKRIRDRKLMVGKTSVNTRANENVRSKELVSKAAGHTVLETSNENCDLSKQSPPIMTSNKPSNPIVDYIKRGPVSSGTSAQNSSQTPTTVATNSTKEPQIELRMTPSQNESVVSINVDELAAKTASGSTREQLSVVISSKRSQTGKMDTSNLNLRSDFGSMQISISENTVPVKQIEFSINGKPVSELKSIVARADKLDVVGSRDRVEIRIPSKEGVTVPKEQAKNIASSKPVLNLQIAAKFNEPRFQQPRGAELKTDPPHMPPPASPAQPTPPTPRAPPVPSKPSRTQNLFTPDTTNTVTTKSEMSEGGTMKSEPTKITKNADASDATDVKGADSVTETKQMDTFSETNIHGSVPREEKVPSIAKHVPSTVKPNEAVFRRNVNESSTGTSEQPTMNNENRSENRMPENRSPSNIIPWWSSEDSFKKIRKKGNTPKSASAFDDTLTPKQAKGIVSSSQKLEQKLNTDAVPTQKKDSTDTVKIDAPGEHRKDLPTKEPAVDETTKSIDFPDPIVSFVRVRSPRKWVPVKSTSGIKTGKQLTHKSSSSSNRIVKRTKYRVRTNLHGRKASLTVKKNSDTPTISAVRSPKIVKYVPVVPQRANMEKKQEPTASNEKLIDDQQKTARKTDNLKFESESKTDTKIGKPVIVEGVGSQIEKANVQHSNTVFKEEKDSKGGANKSADVSAKSTSSTVKFGLGTGKEGKRHGSDGTAERNLPSKPVNEDQRIKEILKTIKPIEKRKDGTLIDYGVIVPSRKPSGKVKQIPRIRTKTPVNIASKESISRQVKIVKPEKVSPTRKQTLTEPRNVADRMKIMGTEKISLAKKPTVVTNSKKIGESKLTMQPGKTVDEKREQKPLATIKKNDFEAQKNSSLTIRELKPSASNSNQAVNTFNTNQPFKRSNSEVTGKAPLEGTLSSKPPKGSQKLSDINIKSTLLDKSKTIFPRSSPLQTPEKRESKNALKAAEHKTPLEGTIAASSKIVDKPAKRIDGLPPTGAINFSASQKSSFKVTKCDNSFLKEATTRLGKDTSKTGVAPLEGTINYRSPKNQDVLVKLINVNEGKKINTDLANRRKGDFLKFNATKKPSNKGGGDTGSDGPVGIPTGPAGLKSQLKDTETPVTCSEQGMDNNDESSTSDQNPDDTYVLFSYESERPEKNMLYSSWLQRFKNKFDDDKII